MFFGRPCCLLDPSEYVSVDLMARFVWGSICFLERREGRKGWVRWRVLWRKVPRFGRCRWYRAGCHFVDSPRGIMGMMDWMVERGADEDLNILAFWVSRFHSMGSVLTERFTLCSVGSDDGKYASLLRLQVAHLWGGLEESGYSKVEVPRFGRTGHTCVVVRQNIIMMLLASWALMTYFVSRGPGRLQRWVGQERDGRRCGECCCSFCKWKLP